ncbi:MAG TPA: hypothetical protein VH370_01940 [Humisphaera sp.]|nr:hypothetical protein [Humisphaera sp.]
MNNLVAGQVIHGFSRQAVEKSAHRRAVPLAQIRLNYRFEIQEKRSKCRPEQGNFASCSFQ